jgi:hypothetical protein
MTAMSSSSSADHDSRLHPFGVDDDAGADQNPDNTTTETFVDDESVPPWDESNLNDDYADFEHEAARIEALFKDPHFAELAAGRNELRPPRSTEARGSIGRAMALGFANVFDPDRVKDDVMVIAERGDGDDDLPETTIDPDEVVFRRKRMK